MINLRASDYRSLQASRLLLLVGLIVPACSIPGIRPEGRVRAISASAPAVRDSVYRRARGWFERNGYIIARETATHIVAHRMLSLTGTGTTHAVIEFEIRSSSATETAYTATSRTERGGRAVDRTSTEPIPGIDALIAYLSCPAARWPSCP